MTELKAFAVGDMDIYAATTPQEALNLFNDQFSEDDTSKLAINEVIELVGDDLDAEYPEIDENEIPTGGVTTIRQWLSEAVSPGWLAGAE